MTDEPELTKQEAIDQLAGSINRFYRKEGKFQFDVLRPASEINIEFVPSGSFSLDRVLSGGFAKGRSVELLGELSTLKTTIALMGCANAQQMGMKTAMYDVEGTFDARRAELLGVDLEELQMVQRDLRGDQALDVVCSLLDQGNFYIIIDSVAALLPKEEVERKLGDDTVARQAHLMSRALRKITNLNRDSVVVFVNQLRESIGVTFGPRTKAPGGKSLGFYATHRVRFSRIETVKEMRPVWISGKEENKSVEAAWKIQAKVEKSKVGRPLGEAVFLFDLDTGLIDQNEEMLNLSLEFGLIRPDGPQHFVVTTTGEKVRWRSGILELIESDPEMYRNQLLPYLRGQATTEPTEPADKPAEAQAPGEALDALRAVLPGLRLPSEPSS